MFYILVLNIIVWLCTVETFEVPFNNIRQTILIAQGRTLKAHKRYSEFFSLRQNLCSAYPRYEKLIPALPPKSVVCTVSLLRDHLIFPAKFRPAFLEKRRRGLELFLSTVLLMPALGASPIVKKVSIES